MTLELVVNTRGFIIKLQASSGCGVEYKTLERKIDKLGGDNDAVMAIDSGVADKLNLA